LRQDLASPQAVEPRLVETRTTLSLRRADRLSRNGPITAYP
jgi:hypothetical protein